MAKQPAKNVNIAIDGTAIEDQVDQFNLNITQETPVTTAFADAGPRRVVGNYDYQLDVQGAQDFAAGEADDLIWDFVGGTGDTITVDPTGATAGTDDPNFDADYVLSSYRISGQVGGRVDFAAAFMGKSALVRATS